MDRGPVALFGAIIAVGIGPAMWLGAQFGSIEVAPTRPPAVVGEPGAVPDRLVGGTGAGDESTGTSVIDATPQSAVRSLHSGASPTPSVTSASPTVAPTTSPSAKPSSSPSSSHPSAPATESTPTAPASASTSSPAVVPEPPVSSSSAL